MKLVTERLEEVANKIYCTDNIGDIVNWFINKPKEYRIVYDSIYDVYGVCDARVKTHDNLAEIMYSSGYVRQFMNDSDIQSIRDYHSSYCPFSAREDQKYRFKNYGTNVYFIFVPKKKNNGENNLDSYYNVCIPISTGNIWIHNEEDFSRNGKLKDLYNKLKNIGEINYLKESFSIDFLYHTVFSEKSYNYVLQNGITADEYGYVYFSEKPLKGYYTFKVKIPNINNLYDWEDFWLDDEGNEIDFDHQYDPNNKYYMYIGNIPIQYIK